MSLFSQMLDAPRQVLDLVDRNRVDGRRASLHGHRAMIELRALDGSTDVDRKRIVAAVESVPGVRWAAVNVPLARVIAALDERPGTAPCCADLVAAVERAESECAAGAGGSAGAPAGSPVDGSRADRAVVALAATGVGLVGSGIGAVLRRAPLSAELAAVVSIIEHQPRVRRVLETTVGRPATDLGLAALSVLGQSLSGSRVGLTVDTAHRAMGMVEARSARAAWQAGATHLAYQRTGFRGQKIEVGGTWTFGKKDDGSFGKTAETHYSTNELKEPLRAAAEAAGWGWHGVAFARL